MKYLSEYMEADQSALFESTGAIFAFSTKSFNEQKVDDVKYIDMGLGMLCPEGNVKTLIDGLTDIHKRSIAQDIADNGKEAIIIRELANHEYCITGDIEPTFEALEGYGFTREDVLKGTHAPNHNGYYLDVEFMHQDSQGYIYFKDISVEHYSFRDKDKELKALKRLQVACLKAESEGFKIDGGFAFKYDF